MSKIDDKALDQIFREAHTFNSFKSDPVTDDDIRADLEEACGSELLDDDTDGVNADAASDTSGTSDGASRNDTTRTRP